MDVNDYQAWIGRTDVSTDVATAEPLRAWLATLDYENLSVKEGAPLPLLAHLIFNKPLARLSDIGPDGHQQRGEFLPPVALPRRMWAGSRFEFRAPLRVGDRLSRRSEVISIQPKTGASGALVFVVVRHTITSASGGEVAEDQTLVFRAAPSAGAPVRAAPGPAAQAPADFSRRVTPSEVMLFRYSALTFNGHRIHYDAPYAKEVEGYSGLIVHGPLLATLMIDLVARELPKAAIGSFEFTARNAVALPATISVCGRREDKTVALWIEHAGAAAVAGKATLR